MKPLWFHTKKTLKTKLKPFCNYFNLFSGIYEDVLSDEKKRDFLIGNKDKLLDDKFNYLKATILKKPIGVVQN